MPRIVIDRGNKKFRYAHGRVAPIRRRGPTNKALNRKINKIKSHQEVKHSDYDVLSTSITANGLLLSDHNYTIVGTSNITRIGNWIRPTSLHIRLRLSNLDTLISTGTTYRILIFWDSQSNGAVPTVYGDNGVLSNVTTLATCEPRNTDTIKRYKILFDRLYSLNAPDRYTDTLAGAVTTTTTTYRSFKAFSKRIRLSRDMQYDGTAGNVTDLVSNAIHVLIISEGTNMSVTGNIRMYFKDV